MSKWWYKKRGELSVGHGQRDSGNRAREVKSKSSSTAGEIRFLNSFLVSENRFPEKKKTRNLPFRQKFNYQPLTLVVEPCSQHLDCRVHLRMVQPAWDSMNSWTEMSSVDGFHSGAKLLWSETQKPWASDNTLGSAEASSFWKMSVTCSLGATAGKVE